MNLSIAFIIFDHQHEPIEAGVDQLADLLQVLLSANAVKPICPETIHQLAFIDRLSLLELRGLQTQPG